jgi:hypothetical protein
MIDLLSKKSILDDLHDNLSDAVNGIAVEVLTHQQKAKKVNALVSELRSNMVSSIADLSVEKRGTAALLVQYCCTVVGLEYRNKVWPYEYMAFSRRIGELWEAFCSTAWTYPVDPSVQRINAPNFSNVRTSLLDRITRNIGIHANSAEILDDVNTLFQIIGDINMREDEVFTKGDVPHVIDFKSGFGSNEKGNMLRLLTVGRAYKIWDHNTELMLLVRQEDNNNYLKVLKKSGLWSVHTGNETYQKIREITGADIESVRNKSINWKEDLTSEFYSYLKNQPTDLTTYLVW